MSSETGFDDATAAKLRPQIMDILKQSDLSVVSAKKIRTALAEGPADKLPAGLDLTAQKKAVDGVIRECYNEFTSSANRRPSNGITLPGRGGVPGDSDADASKSSKSSKRTTKSTGKKRAHSTTEDGETKKKRSEPNPNNPFNRPMRLSPAMAEICGGNEVRLERAYGELTEQMPRHAVVKQLWAYIKGRDLQNQENKRQV